MKLILLRFAAPLVLALMSGPSLAGPWSPDTYEDKLDGKTDQIARLRAKETTILPHRRKADREHVGKMEIRCSKGRKTSLAVGVSGQLVSGHTATMRYRLDDSEPADAKGWVGTTENEGLGIVGKLAEAFAKRLLKAKTMFVRVTDDVFGTTEMSFDLEGMDKAVETVRANCTQSPSSVRRPI